MSHTCIHPSSASGRVQHSSCKRVSLPQRSLARILVPAHVLFGGDIRVPAVGVDRCKQASHAALTGSSARLTNALRRLSACSSLSLSHLTVSTLSVRKTPPEVAAAGHDRCIVNLLPENVDRWLTPERRSTEELQTILSEKQKPYYEHAVAA